MELINFKYIIKGKLPDSIVKMFTTITAGSFSYKAADCVYRYIRVGEGGYTYIYCNIE